MNIFEQVANKRRELENGVKSRIEKSFTTEEIASGIEKAEETNIENDTEGAPIDDEFSKAYGELFEKSRGGVYADTAENRKLGRVGQKYGGGSKKEEKKGEKKPAMSKEDKARLSELSMKFYSEEGLNEKEYNEYHKLQGINKTYQEAVHGKKKK